MTANNSSCTSDIYGNNDIFSQVEAGLTYIGQMIAHDIVQPTDKNIQTRTVTPFLNLDSLYGVSSPYQLEFFPEQTGLMNKRGLFKIKRIEGRFFEANRNEFSYFNGYDFTRQSSPLDQNRMGFKALLPEKRNDENILVAQLHCFWLYFHNWLIKKQFAYNAKEAQRLTILTFQLIVIEHFLKQVIQPSVHAFFFEKNLSLIKDWQSFDWDRTVIPAFFSHAAFRFGHSMVRNNYFIRRSLDPDSNLNLDQLFRADKQLEPRFIVDWTLLFSKPSQWISDFSAFPIDTQVVKEMSAIPDIHFQRVNANIVNRNLQAGQTVQLKFGVDYFKLIEPLALKAGLLANSALPPLSSNLRSCFSSTNKLPLWLYILNESTKKQYLGPVGSVLVSEVLKWSIQGAQYSVFDKGERYSIDTALTTMGLLGESISTFIRDEPFSMRTLFQLIDYNNAQYQPL